MHCVVTAVMLYLQIFQNKHGVVAVWARAVKLNDISVVADQLEDLHLLHIAEVVSKQASHTAHLLDKVQERGMVETSLCMP